MSMPPILQLVANVLKLPRFWLVFLLAMVPFGFLLYQLPEPHRKIICNFYHDHIAAGLAFQFQEKFDNIEEAYSTTQPLEVGSVSGPATQPALSTYAMQVVDEYFCPNRPTEGTWHYPRTSEALAVIPGAFIVSVLLVSLIPVTSTQRIMKVVDAPMDVSVPAQNESDQMLFSEQALKIAVYYAVVSGIVTSLLRPDFVAWANGDGIDGIARKNLVHMAGLAIAAIAVGIYGTWQFGPSKAKALSIALSSAGRGIFVASFITICIALPYQLLKPTDMGPLKQNQVLFILALRLGFLPLLSIIASVLAIRLRRIGKL